MTMTEGLTRLGTQGSPDVARLETFPAPEGLAHVELTSDECQALCPVTGHPDWYVVRVAHGGGGRCVESKSFKEYLWALHDRGEFCEALSARIARDVAAVVGVVVTVTVTQKPRGGVTIEASSVSAG